MRKYISEAIGTFVLVFVGCGTAMLVGCDASAGSGYLLTALAFGLAIVAMAYSIGNVSGCHVNPAVSLAVFMNGGMSGKDFAWYIVSQIVGALLASWLLLCIFALGDVPDATGTLASNGLAGVNGSAGAGFLVETVLTFIFVMAFLGVTSKKEGHGSLAGLVIGLSLALVHIAGIGFTGTSVNPARSIGPAIVATLAGNADPMAPLWVFVLAPLAGGCIAALVYRGITQPTKPTEEAKPAAEG